MPDSPKKPLAQFLASLADDKVLQRYNQLAPRAAGNGLVENHGLTKDQRDAVLSRDVTRIARELMAEEQETKDKKGKKDKRGKNQKLKFLVPAGPTMTGPAKFRVKLQGVMVPDPLIPEPTRARAHPFGTMDRESSAFSAGRSLKTSKTRSQDSAARPKTKASSGQSAAKKTDKSGDRGR